MTSAQRMAITAPAMGLLVYDINTESFWLRGSTAWVNLLTGKTGWSMTGNIASSTEFLGTTNNQSLLFKANNQQAGKIDLFSSNTFWGAGAGENSTSTDNTALGKYALHFNTMGSRNNAIGVEALEFNTIGNENNAFGYQTLQYNTSGGQNTACGTQAMFGNLTGIGNSAYGFQALLNNTAGNYNTAIGFGALYGNAGFNGSRISTMFANSNEQTIQPLGLNHYRKCW
jgi:hypothetical protein